MPRPASLHPVDVVLALRLLEPAGTYAALADELLLAPSQVHAAIRRLERSVLVRAASRATDRAALLDFLSFGVRFAFPAQRGAIARGVPTADSAMPLAADVDAADTLVWPAPNDASAVSGFAVVPLIRSAPALRSRLPRLYELLTLVDALRLGDLRAMAPARARLTERLRRG